MEITVIEDTIPSKENDGKRVDSSAKLILNRGSRVNEG